MPDRFIGHIKGRDAQQPNFSFVAPDTLAPGAQATIQNLGSSQHPVLKFGIPAGIQGAPGAAIRGEQGIQGERGEPGLNGTSATIDVYGTTLVDTDEEIRVENVGSSQRASLHFFLKRPPEEITIDEELVENSTNPVQSKAIQEALATKADASSIPTKVSELTNDRNFVSESNVNVLIEDAVSAAVATANPIDGELSDISTRPVQNKVITSALGERAIMEVEDVLDSGTQTIIGERVTLSNADKAVSIVLTGENIENTVLSQNFAERIPTIVSALPTQGSLDRLYLVPADGDNYSMHIWMEVDGVEKWVNVQSGSSSQYSVYDDYRIVQLTEANGDFTKLLPINIINGILLSVLNNKVIGCLTYFNFTEEYVLMNSTTQCLTDINFAKYGLEISESLNFNYSPNDTRISIGGVEKKEYTIMLGSGSTNPSAPISLRIFRPSSSSSTIPSGASATVRIGTFL